MERFWWLWILFATGEVIPHNAIIQAAESPGFQAEREKKNILYGIRSEISAGAIFT